MYVCTSYRSLLIAGINEVNARFINYSVSRLIDAIIIAPNFVHGTCSSEDKSESTTQ